MFDKYKTTLCLGSNSVYEIKEIVEWCTLENGEDGFSWTPINDNTYEFKFTSTMALVRFGLTWNKQTIRYRPRMHA